MIYTETEDEYDAIMSTCDWRYGIGLVWTAFNQRDKFLDMASLHYGLVAIEPMIAQLREGLQTYNVWRIILNVCISCFGC